MNGEGLIRDSRPAGRRGGKAWHWPLAVSLVLHVAAFVFTMVAPSIWKRPRPLDQIVTVDLISMAEGQPDASPGPPAGAAAPPPPPAPPPKAVPEPRVTIAPEEPPPPPVAAAPEAKPVSLAPIKRKKQKADDTRLVEEREREQQDKKKKEAEEQARQLAEKNRKEAEAKAKQEIERRKQEVERARLEAERTRQEADRLKQLADKARREAGQARLDALRGDLRSGTGGGGGSRGGSQLSIIEQQYYASLVQHIRPYWDLPEMKSWPKDTEAVVLVTIAADGKVLRIDFERRSKESVYDQYVMQSLRKASPMPPFPAAMQRRDVEVGLRFKPGDLGSM